MMLARKPLSIRSLIALLALVAVLSLPLAPAALYAQEGEPIPIPDLTSPASPDDGPAAAQPIEAWAEVADLEPGPETLAAELQVGGQEDYDPDAGVPASAEAALDWEAALLDVAAAIEEGGPQEGVACLDGACLEAGAAPESLVTLHSALMSQSTASMPGASESQDQFAYALAADDFNGDGRDDLVIGAPFEDIAFADDGLFLIVPGHAEGTIAAVRSFWQGSTGVPGAAEVNDRFGYSFATGDFDGDGFADLAVGAPGESDGAATFAGAVVVLYGGLSGITTAGAQIFTQNTGSIPDTSETGDQWGATLAAGDFNNNGADDLAVGAFYEDLGTVDGAGQVTILYGAPYLGLRTTGSQIFSQNTAGVEGGSETQDYFGVTLATGHFDANPYADLAIGIPYEDIGAESNGGAVSILHGSNAGLTASGDALLYEDLATIAGLSQPSEYFGYGLAVGDINSDGRDEIFIGVPGQDVGAMNEAGSVQMITRGPGGYASTGPLLHRALAGIPGDPATSELFGLRIACGDFNMDGKADLVVGAYRRTVSGHATAGEVVLVHRVASSATIVGQSFSLNTIGVPGIAAVADWLGYTLAVGDFNGDLRADLVAGVPNRDEGSVTNSGAALELFNSRNYRALTPCIWR